MNRAYLYRQYANVVSRLAMEEPGQWARVPLGDGVPEDAYEVLCDINESRGCGMFKIKWLCQVTDPGHAGIERVETPGVPGTWVKLAGVEIVIPTFNRLLKDEVK